MSKAKILLVDDEVSVHNVVTAYLEAEGYAFASAMDGNEGLRLARSFKPDLILLDVMLPGMDGVQLCKRLREDGNNEVPILMLTARDALEDRLTGLQAGADDYLVKPFALSELVARIEAILRRTHGSRKRCLAVADLRYDLDTLHVTRAGQPLKLNPIGLKLLEILMQKSPAVIRREALEEALWGDDCPDSDSLRSHIHQLRQVLDKPFPTPLLHTLHGIGYRLAEPGHDR